MIIKELDILSFAKFQSILTCLLGLVLGVIYSFGGLIVDTLVSLDVITSTETPGLSYGSVLAFGALVGMPLISASVGYVCGLCEAILYNLFAKVFKGIHLNVKS